MRDEELQRVLNELDAAAKIIRRHRTEPVQPEDAKIEGELAEIRHELAVYRAILQLRPQRRMD